TALSAVCVLDLSFSFPSSSYRLINIHKVLADITINETNTIPGIASVIWVRNDIPEITSNVLRLYRNLNKSCIPETIRIKTINVSNIYENREVISRAYADSSSTETTVC